MYKSSAGNVLHHTYIKGAEANCVETANAI